MVPPPVLHSSVPVDLEAPLSKWRIFSIHDSAAQCEQRLVAFFKLAKTELAAVCRQNNLDKFVKELREGVATKNSSPFGPFGVFSSHTGRTSHWTRMRRTFGAPRSSAPSHPSQF
jgi:hypothetical protein